MCILYVTVTPAKDQSNYETEIKQGLPGALQ